MLSLPSLILQSDWVSICPIVRPSPKFTQAGVGPGVGGGGWGSVLDKAWEGEGPSIYSPLQRGWASLGPHAVWHPDQG